MQVQSAARVTYPGGIGSGHLAAAAEYTAQAVERRQAERVQPRKG